MNAARHLPVLVVALLAAALLAPAAPAGAVGPSGGEASSSEQRGARASGWKQRCNRKPTKRQRRACKRNHRRQQKRKQQKQKQKKQQQQQQPQGGAPAVAADAVYSGTMQTTIDYYDICSRFIGSQQTSLAVSVIVGPPLGATRQAPELPAAVGTETNPVRLVVGESTVAANLAPGSLSLASSQRFNGTSPNVNLQYWSLALNGAALTGTLVEDHREEAGAYNLLGALQQLVPCQAQFGSYPSQFAIAEGAQLTGTLSAAAVQLQVSGNVVEGTRPFLAQISANRVR